ERVKGDRPRIAALVNSPREFGSRTTVHRVLEGFQSIDVPFALAVPPTLSQRVSGETPNRRWSRWKSCCFATIPKLWTPTSRTTCMPLHIGPLAHEVRSKSSGCRASRFDAESFLLAAHDTDGVELAA